LEDFAAVQLTIPFFWDHSSRDPNISKYVLLGSSTATAPYQDFMTLETKATCTFKTF
jgi:hypothetical protein